MTLATGDLTTLAVAKQYLDSPPSDPILSGLITRVSAEILSWLNRGLLIPKSYVDQYDGTGTSQLVIPNWPLLSLSSLTVSGTPITRAPQLSDSNTFAAQFGYRFQPWNGVPPGDPAVIQLIGFYFYPGYQNVVAEYEAGYAVSGETATIPLSTPFTILPAPTQGIWATDRGVINSGTGAAFTPIASGTPSAGQYVPPNPSAATPVSTYTFAAADAGTGVLLSYGYVPAAIEQVALEMIGERASYRKRVGLRSQSLAGQETIAYDLSGIPNYAKAVLAPYMSVIPASTGALV